MTTETNTMISWHWTKFMIIISAPWHVPDGFQPLQHPFPHASIGNGLMPLLRASIGLVIVMRIIAANWAHFQQQTLPTSRSSKQFDVTFKTWCTTQLDAHTSECSKQSSHRSFRKFDLAVARLLKLSSAIGSFKIVLSIAMIEAG